MLLSLRSFAVPPVDKISIFNNERPFANSAIPDLSETLIKALFIGILGLRGVDIFKN